MYSCSVLVEREGRGADGSLGAGIDRLQAITARNATGSGPWGRCLCSDAGKSGWLAFHERFPGYDVVMPFRHGRIIRQFKSLTGSTQAGLDAGQYAVVVMAVESLVHGTQAKAFVTQGQLDGIA